MSFCSDFSYNIFFRLSPLMLYYFFIPSFVWFWFKCCLLISFLPISWTGFACGYSGKEKREYLDHLSRNTFTQAAITITKYAFNHKKINYSVFTYGIKIMNVFCVLDSTFVFSDFFLFDQIFWWFPSGLCVVIRLKYEFALY